MALPLFYYPTRWVWVDDDLNLLKTAARIFSRINPVLPFNQPRECIEYLQRYQSPLASQAFLKSAVDNELYGTLHHAPVDFDIVSLTNIQKMAKRYDEISVVVMDYGMPELNGLMLAEAIKLVPIKKILLTGEAENSQAISAFNCNLIDRFVRKGDQETAEQLQDYLTQLTLKFFQEKTEKILSYLETERPLPLTDPVFIHFFQGYCKKNAITEYYLLDKQGSFMLINENDEKHFLVVHTDHSLHELLELYNDVAKTPELLAIQQREKIPFFGVGREGWEFELEAWQQYLHMPAVFEGRERYYWAVVGEKRERNRVEINTSV